MRKRGISTPVIQLHFIYDNVITWGDSTTEHIQIDSSGFFYLNGIRRKLLGMTDPLIYASGNYWDTSNLAILDTELTYLQSKGVRLYQVSLGQTTSNARYTAVMDLLYAHKMLAVPMFTLKGSPNFDDLTTTDFKAWGGVDNASVAFTTWVNAVKAYSNVVSIVMENEMDIPLAGESPTLANAQLYMDMLYAVAKSLTTIPIHTKFGMRNYTAYSATVQDAFLTRYSAVPCFDIYKSTAADFTTELINTQRWYITKGSYNQMWLTETNYWSSGYNAALLTKAMIDAMFAQVAVVFLFSVQCNSADSGTMFFDAAGNPIANLGTLLGVGTPGANVATWQAAI